MRKYRKILQSALNGNLPDEIERSSCGNFDLFHELYEAGYLSGVYEPYYGGVLITNPQITLSGRAYLNQLNQNRIKPIIIFLSWLSGVFSTVLIQYLLDLLKTGIN